MDKVCPTCQREFPDDVGFCPHDGMKLRTRKKAGSDPMIGRVLDNRWIIEERIGEGGMGAVYLGHQRSVDRKVAIKTLRPSLAETEDFVDRFFREARVATTINHPHCVTIHDFGQSDDGTLYLAMEYLEGQPLTDRVNSKDLTVEEILTIGMQIASALSAAHDAQIVHRDLKPDNIFMLDIPGGGTFVKVLDFGIAKVLGADTQMTRTGQVFGTPSYMSPEQCQGNPVDGRSDLYSLGCILYELVGGRPPFVGETPMAVLMAHVVNEVPPLTTLEQEGLSLEPRLEQAIMKLLSKAPDERPSSASEARALLEGIIATMKSEHLAHLTSDLMPTFSHTITAESITPEAIRKLQKHNRSSSTEEFLQDAQIASSPNRGLYIVIAMVSLIGVAVLFALFLRGDNAVEEIDHGAAQEQLASIEGSESPADDALTSTELLGEAISEADQEVGGAVEQARDQVEEAQTDTALAEGDEAQESTTASEESRSGRRQRDRRTPREPSAPPPPSTRPTPPPAPTPPPVVEEEDVQESEEDPLDFFGSD